MDDLFLAMQSGDVLPLLRFVNQIEEQILLDDSRGNVHTEYEMLREGVMPAVAASIRGETASSFIGEYANPEIEIDEYIKDKLADAQLDARSTFTHQCTIAEAVGFNVSQPIFMMKNGDIDYRGLYSLDPRFVQFKGNAFGINNVEYTGSSTGTKSVEYERIMHVTAGFGINPVQEPFGTSRSRTALGPFTASKIVHRYMAIAAKTQAVPLLVGKADPKALDFKLGKDGQPLRDDQGHPQQIPATLSLAKAMQSVGSTGFLVTHIANEINALDDFQANDQFFINILNYLNQLILNAYSIPPTLVQVLGSGDSNLAENQFTLLRRSARNTANLVANKFLRHVVRPMIDFKFGVNAPTGEFTTPSGDPADNVDLVGAVVGAAREGILGEEVDPNSIVDRVRVLTGIPSLDQEQQEELKDMKEQMREQSMEQEQAQRDIANGATTNPPTDEE